MYDPVGFSAAGTHPPDKTYGHSDADDRRPAGDGREGPTVLQAAIEAGIQVPYYCYHPGLGIDASCRVCLVKIEKMPKLQTSCSTPVAEGMVVLHATPDVVEARAGVFEFLLINHPLDCPVCDKGGECPLQDFSYAFGHDESRMDFPRRTFDGEGVKADVDFGPTLMLNRNRCILCTRCIRFMREVDGDAQIGIVDRGNGSEIATFDEQGVHSLLSGNLMDVCPVGAITTREYRFRSRPWDNPNAVDTICTLCSKGCSTTAWLKAKPEWAKGAQLVRVTPRYNAEVNGYWMCDIGRFEYHWVEGDDAPDAAAGSRRGRPRRRRRGTPRSLRAAALKRRRRGRAAAALPASRRTPRTKRCIVLHASRSACWATPRAASTSAGRRATSSSRPAPSSRCRRSMRPTSDGARDSRPRRVGDRRRRQPDARRRCAAQSRRASVSALYVVDPGPGRDRSATCLGHRPRADGQAPSLIVQGVVAHRAGARPPTSCCRALPGSRRTRPTRTTRGAAGGVAR